MFGLTRWIAPLVVLTAATGWAQDAQDPQRTPTAPFSSPCTAPEVTAPFNAEFYWRWKAYRELDCAIEAIERAMRTSARSEAGTVTLTRDELEHLRARAFWARDAAARIGR